MWSAAEGSAAVAWVRELSLYLPRDCIPGSMATVSVSWTSPAMTHHRTKKVTLFFHRTATNSSQINKKLKDFTRQPVRSRTDATHLDLFTRKYDFIPITRADELDFEPSCSLNYFFLQLLHKVSQRNFAAVRQIYPLISYCAIAAHHPITGFLQTAEWDSWLSWALWLTCFNCNNFKWHIWIVKLFFFFPAASARTRTRCRLFKSRRSERFSQRSFFACGFVSCEWTTAAFFLPPQTQQDFFWTWPKTADVVTAAPHFLLMRLLSAHPHKSWDVF